MSTCKFVYRDKHEKNYTVISNRVLQDAELSISAAGLLGKMLSLPDHWVFNINHLASIARTGVRAVWSAMKELEARGYIVKYAIRDKLGRFVRWVTEVYETPKADGDSLLSSLQKPRIGGSTFGDRPPLESNKGSNPPPKKVSISPPTPSEIQEGEELKTHSFLGIKSNSQLLATFGAMLRPLFNGITDLVDQLSAAPLPVENLTAELRKWLSNRVFIQWWANRVSKTKFGSEELEMPPVAYVKARIRKNPQQAADMYAAFEDEMSLRVETLQARVEGGIQLSQEEREEMAAIAPYSQVALPEVPPSSPTPPEPAPELPAPAAQLPAAQLPEEDSSEPGANMRRLREMLKGVGRNMQKVSISEPVSLFEKYRSWIQGSESALRAEAVQWAKRRDDVSILYEADGITPYDLQQEDVF